MKKIHALGRIKIFILVLTLMMMQQSMAVVPMVTGDKIIKLHETVYVIPDQRIPLVPNVGIIIGSRGVLVVDTGMGPANAKIILTRVRRLTAKPILYLVSTHFHPEHNFGAQAFPDETVIIFSTAQQQELNDKGMQYQDWFVDMFKDDVRQLLASVKLVPADITFTREAVINLGNFEVHLMHLGQAAHTRGDTLIYLPQQKILFSGGLTPNRLFPIMPDKDSSGAGWINSLEQLEQLQINTIVPGHGEIGDKSLIFTVKKYLLDLRRRVSTLHAEKKSLETIIPILQSEFEKQYPRWGEPFWIKNAAEIFYSEQDK